VPAPLASIKLGGSIVSSRMTHLQQVFAYLSVICYVCCAAFFAAGAILSWLSTPKPW
jgi:hypothetical protein